MMQYQEGREKECNVCSKGPLMGLDDSRVAQLISCCPAAVMVKELGHQEGSVQVLAWTQTAH